MSTNGKMEVDNSPRLVITQRIHTALVGLTGLLLATVEKDESDIVIEVAMREEEVEVVIDIVTEKGLQTDTETGTEKESGSDTATATLTATGNDVEIGQKVDIVIVTTTETEIEKKGIVTAEGSAQKTRMIQSKKSFRRETALEEGSQDLEATTMIHATVETETGTTEGTEGGTPTVRPEGSSLDDFSTGQNTDPRIRRVSPTYEPPPQEDYNPDEPKEDDSEARSVFVSQLAARMTARDLGYFFEDKLGEGAVMDSRIVTDRISRRSKGIGYVEFKTIELVEKAIALTGTVVMGLPIMVQLTESERNRLHPGDGNLNLPPGVSAPHGGGMLYVGSLHFNLTESDIKQVFEPFGPLDFVDLHRDPMTGRSKGYAFVQYKRAEHAKMALEQMEGFELAGRTLRVNTVHEKGSVRYTQQDSLDDSGGGNLNAASRQALMQKLARIETPLSLPEPVKPNIPTQAMQSRSVLLKNMFDPEEETEKDWDKDLADDVKGECEDKYGKVIAIKVEKETQGEIYVKFDAVETAKKAIQGLNGRWFGGKQVTASFISDAIMQAHQ
ncbi:Phosphatidylinositol-3-phosphatase SAC1 [Paramarasmius palmivorus]|uniref:Phosphatidylinositol-3-phosphatase SAC1 n=1 Tax=Paramarasmius palmivorus TaxID=297713 RepID=A0AAW0E7D7_9AGAR